MAAFSERLAWLDRLAYEIGQKLSYAIRNTPSHASFFVAMLNQSNDGTFCCSATQRMF
jgi:hypothetical protein